LRNIAAYYLDPKKKELRPLSWLEMGMVPAYCFLGHLSMRPKYTQVDLDKFFTLEHSDADTKSFTDMGLLWFCEDKSYLTYTKEYLHNRIMLRSYFKIFRIFYYLLKILLTRNVKTPTLVRILKIFILLLSYFFKTLSGVAFIILKEAIDFCSNIIPRDEELTWLPVLRKDCLDFAITEMERQYSYPELRIFRNNKSA